MEPFDRWVRKLGGQARNEPRAEPPGVYVDVAAILGSLRIPSAPTSDAFLVLSSVRGDGRFTVLFDDPPPARLVMKCASPLRYVQLHGVLPAHVTIELDDVKELTLRSDVGFQTLELSGGHVNAETHSPTRLLLTNTKLAPSTAWTVDSLVLGGQVDVAAASLVARSTAFSGGQGCECVLGSRKFQMGEVSAEPVGESINVTLRGGNAQLQSLPPSSVIVLDNSQITFPSTASDVEGLKVQGLGVVSLGGRLIKPLFEPSPDPNQTLTIEVDDRGEVLNASGRVALNCSGVCTGDEKEPLELIVVGRAESARLENLNLYSLAVPDLYQLESAERLSPWIPDRKKAKKLEDGQRMGLRDAQTILSERAHFWAKLSEILKKKHSAGAVQARVRYAAARTRASTLPAWSRERLLLRLYWLVGYGERIGQPLAMYATVTLPAALILISRPWVFRPERLRTWGDIGKAWVRMIAAPVSFFRFGPGAPHAEAGGLWGDITVGLMAALGVVMLFFSLSAMRRITKAE